MTSHFSDMTSWSIFFDVVLFLLLSLGTTQSSMSISSSLTIFFNKGLTRNPEIRNTLVWLLPNIWRLRWVMDTKFGMNVSNRMLLNAAKCQGYSFYRFWVIKGKPTWRGGGGKIIPPPPPRFGLSTNFTKWSNTLVWVRLNILWDWSLKVSEKILVYFGQKYEECDCGIYFSKKWNWGDLLLKIGKHCFICRLSFIDLCWF